MREFSIVYTKIWHDAKFRALDNAQKQLFLYILSCPHGNMLGCFTLPLEYIAYDIGLTTVHIKLLLEGLIDKKLISFDFDNNIIFIKNYLKHNKISGSNSEKGILNLYNTLPFDSLLTKEVAEMINFHLKMNLEIHQIEPKNAPSEVKTESKMPLTSPLQAPYKPLQEQKMPPITPLQGACNPLPQEIERDIEIEIERDIDTNTILSHSAAPRLTASKNSNDDVIKIFEHWKTETGHLKTALDDKRKLVIKKAMKMGYSVDQLMDAVSGCCKTPHNMGKNDRGEKYDGIGLIFRSADQIDRFIRNNKSYLRDGATGFDQTVRNLQMSGKTLEELLPC